MKLSTKLLLAFGATIVLIAAISCLSWYATAKYDRQKEVLLLAETIITDVMKTESHVAKAIIDYDPEPIAEAYKVLEDGKQSAGKLLGIVTSQENKDHLNNIFDNIGNYAPILNQIETLFKDFNATYEEVRKLGNKVQNTLDEIAVETQRKYELTGDAEEYKIASDIALIAANIRYSLMAFLFVEDDETYKNANTLIDNANKLFNQDNVKNNPIFAETISDIKTYLDQVKPLLETGAKIQDLREQSNKGVQYALQESTAVANLSTKLFNDVSATVRTQLVIASIVAILLGILLTILISRNIMKQLGTDPGELSVLAERVTKGDYDINDGKEHIGVYRNIIMMVEKLKETLQFSQNVLSSMPIPVAVFGSNNKLKYANREMMGLLEITKKMEDCIGETSGTFMYRQENFNTATCKAIASKQTGRLTLEYETHKGNHINVATIAQPLIDAHGDVTDVISVWQDITETVRQNKVIADSHQNMQNIAAELEQVATIASSASEQLSAQIELSENGAQDQADRVATTATALEEMNATVLEIARNAGTTSDSASNVRSEASAGSESMQECVKAMHEVKEESLKLQTEMGVLSEHAQAINEIMNVISDIADQTNLLALNAAIEAARAGEAGRGFAVVADEVRNLAEKTMTSTTDVGNAISAIQKSTADNTRLVVDAVEKIERVTEMVSGAGEALLGIVQLADTTADQVRAIATASEEQSATSEEITQSVDSINNIAKENANNMQEARKAVDEVVNQTHVLSQLIEQLQAQNKAE
ncbi:MAG: methyl-accepting chemotaxis protein [Mailhella sp.]